MKLIILPGDGIGPEITAAALAVLARANERFALGLQCTLEEIGLAALKKEGTTLPIAQGLGIQRALLRSQDEVTVAPFHLRYEESLADEGLATEISAWPKY